MPVGCGGGYLSVLELAQMMIECARASSSWPDVEYAGGVEFIIEGPAFDAHTLFVEDVFNVLANAQAQREIDHQTNRAKLYVESPLVAQLAAEYEREKTPLQRIKDDWSNPDVKPGQIALDVASVTGRGVQALSAGASGIARAFDVGAVDLSSREAASLETDRRVQKQAGALD
jgi:hypothetical protein